MLTDSAATIDHPGLVQVIKAEYTIRLIAKEYINTGIFNPFFPLALRPTANFG
jgi:hypothetical protein